jgi:EAL domain-containing protein (putative c-di-GMP-specific phosphodiesterase class I)
MLDILAKAPGDAEGWFNMGLSELKSGRLDTARSCFAMAAAADPSLLPAVDSVTMLLRPDGSPGDDDFIMGVVRLPAWKQLGGGSTEQLLKGVLTCLDCQAGLRAGPDSLVSDSELAKGIVFALQGLMQRRSPLGLGELAEGVGAVVGEALDTVKTFKRMVADRQFGVVFQPIVELRDGTIHHYEALCRFGGEGESPFKAITFAEQAGLVHEFDLAMARVVVDRLRAGGPRRRDLRIAVNVSGYSIGIPSYLDGLMELLKANRWTRGRLMFEITESSRMADLDTANTFIQAVRRLGHEVCLDDFGAGAASFQYLSMLDVDAVKIDGSAIANARRGDKGRALLSALTDLCRRIGVVTVAEMVEDADCLAFCRACGCDWVQGFLFGRPAHDMAAFRPLPNAELLAG